MSRLLVFLALTVVAIAQTGAGGVVGSSGAKESALLVDGRCSICIREHEKSTVTMDGFGTCTLLGCGPGHYDEDGHWAAPLPCNTCTSYGHCSRGHLIVLTYKM